MKLRNIGLNYKGKEINHIKEIHVTAAHKNGVRVVYDERENFKLEEKVIVGNIQDFQIFDKSENK